ncbi:hypothetical protein M3Y97_00934600 [Aphelenchoides bicaudatus]|nr:hypothetical protein M3Y97_00934600 [Aphelenchoides bicaudatus]
MLDEEVVSTSKSESVYTNTVSVLVRSDVDQESSIQLWPCVHVPSTAHIPQAVKDIYSRLAQAAEQIDQGMPQIVLSLVGTGNGFGNETNNKLHQGLKRLIGHCGLWLVTSGEFDDPMARVLAQTLRHSLSQMEDPSETLVIVANSQRAIHKASHSFSPNDQLEMVDTRYNTLYVLLKEAEISEDEELAFRCRLAMKLASPPPALLIGVPDDRATMYGTAAQTPISSSAPAIILPSSLQTCERKPMPVTLFCGASLKSLNELGEYIECGIPVLVVQLIKILTARFYYLSSSSSIMTTPNKRKHQIISLSEKQSIIEKSITMPKTADLVKHFDNKYTESTIRTIVKNKDIIQKAIDDGVIGNRIRLKVAKHANLEEALSKWVKSAQRGNISFNGPVLKDTSELCAILRNALILYKSAGFEHESFIQWLDNELRAIYDGSFEDGEDAESLVQSARQNVLRVLAAGVGPDHSLIAFIPVDSINELPEHILELFIECMSDPHAYPNLLELALRLNSPSIVRQLSVGDLRRETVSSILEQVLASERSIHVLSALLDQKVPLILNADLLFKWFENTFDKYFFQAIILGSLLGYAERPDHLDERLANDINNLLRHLSGGIQDLFPAHVLFMPINEKRQDQAQTLQIMAIWALLMNQLELVKCLCAYAPEPLGLSIVLAKIARSLAYESHEWFFFEQRLYALSDYLRKTAYGLLSDAFDESPIKAYKALCYKSEMFNQLTVPQLAYETTTRAIIAHECCQRWVLRLLYGNLQLVTLSRHIRLSNWLKIVICALFVIPIRWWISQRPPAIHRRRGGGTGMRRAASPTVTMLEMGRQPKRTVGAFSTYSTHSGRSNYLRDDFLIGQTTREATPFDMHQTHHLDESAHENGHQPETPQSARSAGNPTAGTLDDVESSLLYGQMLETRFFRPSMSPQPKKQKGMIGRRRAGFRDLVMFYSTPIVKYWMSLVFRLGYLALLAYTVGLKNFIINSD